PADRIAGVGVADALDRGVGHQLNVIAVVGAQDGHIVRPLFRHGLAAPLGQPVAGDGGAVAEFGGQRLYKADAPYVGVEHLIHQLADIFKDVTALDKFLVVGGGGGDSEGVAPAGIELGV